MLSVLVACEESQAVCSEFRRLGHRAFSCDLQACSGGHPEWHICGDVLPLLNGACSFTTADGQTHEQAGKWDLIIAHPPCTYLSNAGACRLYPHKGQIDPERYAKGMDGKRFFMRFVECGQNGGRVAIENPVPSSVFGLPQKSQVIQPWQFGHPYTKKTYLWLFNLPSLCPTEIVTNYAPYVVSGMYTKTRDPKYKGASRSGGAAKTRSRTFPGIAQAMAEQWAAYIEEDKT